MSTLRTTLALAAVALISVSCSESGNPLNSTPVRGSGSMLTETRNLPAFDGLTLSAAGEINITFGTPQSISVTVDDNIMPYLETVHQNGGLDIRIQNGISAHDYDLVVNIVVADLHSLTLQGAGTIRGLDRLTGDHLELALTGAGTINLDLDMTSVNSRFTGPGSIFLSGSATTHTSYIATPGTLHAFALATSKTSLNLSGPGSAEVHAADSLHADLSGIGSVYYHGNPVITGSRTGIGKVVNSN